jgi:glycosyltransferase involved in cell wall biosynthesis
VNSDSHPVLAVDATRMARQRTGIENFLHHVLPGLVQGWTSPADHAVGPGRVKVFARDPTIADHVEPRPDVVGSATRGWTQVALPDALRKAGADVYFSPIPILPMVRRMPCPAVVTVHDFHDFRARWWYFRRLLEHTFATARAIVCVSQATQRQLVEEFPSFAERVVVIREGADPKLFHPADGGPGQPPVLHRLGIEEAPWLAVGTIQPRKNYARLIAAYARLERDRTPPLVIVGRPGWDYEEVMALPEQLGVSDRITFTGHLPEEDVADLMRAASLLVAVSTGEGFGLPLVEAMYSGVPILASDIPPFREVAGNAARFVDPSSESAIRAGLELLWSDAAARSTMSEVGLSRRQLFSWDAAADAIVKVLRRALISI